MPHLWPLLLALTACEPQCGPMWRPPDLDNDDPTPLVAPFRDDWRIAASVPFEHTRPDGSIAIDEITIGGRLTGGTNQNFANRGDVIVELTGDPNDPRIVIALRRFTAALDEEAAREDFDRLSLWAFDTLHDAPLAADLMEPSSACAVDGGWRDHCGIRVHYDGLSQLARAGADIRITLPADYRGAITVITEDNDQDADYFNRGNVCVHGLAGSADIELDAGEAFVVLARDVTPAPSCSADAIAQCEAWPCQPGEGSCTDALGATVTEGALAWAAQCPCMEFGMVAVESHDARAADVTVDAPSTLWATISVLNEDIGQDAGIDASHCEAEVALEGTVALEGPGNDFPWERHVMMNHPSPSATLGAGYNIVARSSACEPVAATENPEDFVGAGNGSTQETTERGNLLVCDGCLVATPCDALLP